MKKMNAFIAALTLAATALSPLASSAANLSGDSKTMEVSQTHNSSYIITIPDGVQDIAEGTKLAVSASGLLEYGETITISVDSENGWKLKDAKHEENNEDISYKMAVNDKAITTEANDILEVSYSDSGQTGSVEMVVSEIANPTYAGTYHDILTFSARTNIEQTAAATTTTVDEAQ